MSGAMEGVYTRLPVWAQHVAVSSYGLYWRWLRFGPGSAALLDEFTSREQFTADEWQRHQTARLARLLPLAAEEVPYYARHWTSTQKAAAREGRLSGLPLLSKDAVRADPGSFVRSDRRDRHFVHHTSGSTGTPVASARTAREIRAGVALREARSARWAGVSFSSPRATFSGRMVEPDPSSSGPFYRYNLAERQVYLSPFHLSAETAPAYVAALRRHDVVWLTGYAVSYYLLARHILAQQLSVPATLEAVVTTSEKVTPAMRDVMERAFGCRVYEEYSTVENVMFASECEAGSLHVSPDAGVVEILRRDGTPCEPGESGEVVATSLIREQQPLVRYCLGDIAAWDPGRCDCGRSMPVLREIVGRLEDVVVGPDGREMVRFHGIFVDQPHVVEGQIVQEAIDRIRVRVVPTGQFDRKDEADITSRLQHRLGSQVEVLVERVATIPRTKSGKFKAVVNCVGSEG